MAPRDRPLHALSRHHSDPSRAALAAQYMAMAGQHPDIREAIGKNVEQSRVTQIALIEEARTRVSGERGPSAAAISMMIAARASPNYGTGSGGGVGPCRDHY